jgi:DNA-binding LacI/PurR family transcriptional regulator
MRNTEELSVESTEIGKDVQPDTLTDQAVQTVMSMLQLGELGEPIPPERQLAGLLGISRVTMRRAMTTLETQGYVRRKQGQGTYSSFGPSMSTVEELTHLKQPYVAILTEQCGEQFNPQTSPWTWQVCLALERNLLRDGVKLRFVNSSEFLRSCDRGQILASPLQGFVAPSHLWHPDQYETAMSCGIPFVGIGRTSRSIFWNIIDLDHREGLRQAFDALKPTPKDRVFIPLQEHPAEVDRQAWQELVMEELDRRNVPASQIVIKAGGMFESQGYLATKWYLREYDPPTIILADFDLCVVGAYRALLAARENGTLRASDLRQLRCLGGGDLSIGRRVTPPFDSLRFDSEKVATMIQEMLHEQTRKKGPTALRYLQASFIARS